MAGRNLSCRPREPCPRREQSPCTRFSREGFTPGLHLAGCQNSRLVHLWEGSQILASPKATGAHRACVATLSPSLTPAGPPAGSQAAWTLLMSSKSKPAVPGLQSDHGCRKHCITACTASTEGYYGAGTTSQPCSAPDQAAR